MANNKLELTWLDKDKPIKVEPRLLIENPKLSNIPANTNQNTDGIFDNLLIHGDNLIALKSLESKYAGRVKCIYIDPPYNTGSAFEHYDDNLEHSLWLSLMRDRLLLLCNLLHETGSIFIQIDDNEMAYLKILCDEVFGRKNFITTLAIKMSTISGVKTSHREKTIVKEKEFILVYAKEVEKFGINPQYTPLKYLDAEFQYYLDKHNSNNPDNWEVFRLSEILAKNGLPEKISEIDLTAKNKISEDVLRFIENNQNNIWRRAFIRNDFKKLSQDNPNKIFTNYSENKTHYYYRGREMFFVADKIHTCLTEDGYKTTLSNLLADMWLDINTGRLFNEGGVEFRNSKKPEFLIARILEIASSKNDIILDSFLGSGTTASVAHKMGRKWIGIEMGDHAYSLCKVRLDNVINNSDPGGVSNIFNWSGGGGYKFYELAPTLIKIDSFGQAIINPEYNADMLAAAVALHEGYNYEPDQTLFWKQAKNGESSYLFTTTRHLDRTFIDSVASQMTENEFLVISCKSFDALVLNLHKNIAIKKIPQSLLKNCEFDKDNYNLNIINPPVYEGDEEDE